MHHERELLTFRGAECMKDKRIDNLPFTLLKLLIFVRDVLFHLFIDSFYGSMLADCRILSSGHLYNAWESFFAIPGGA